MQRPAVSVVIPVWNAAEVTEKCLLALRGTLREDDEVIVVDDGSSDRTPELLHANADWVTSVGHERNLGFGAACNLGAARASNPVIIFLNNDTLPSLGWIEDLLVGMRDPNIGAVGPMSDNVSGAQQVSDIDGNPLRGLPAHEQVRRSREKDGPSWINASRLVGFCLAVRADVFRELGGFDLRYRQGGFEDDDLCTRLLLAGWRLAIVTSAFVQHEYHATFDANSVDWYAIQTDNGKLYREKLENAYPLSVLVRAGHAPLPLLQTLLSVQSAAAHTRYEVLLLVEDREPLRELLDVLEGDVTVVTTLPSDPTWRHGQHVATGLRRICMRAGDVLTPLEISMMLNAPMGTQMYPDIETKAQAS